MALDETIREVREAREYFIGTREGLQEARQAFQDLSGEIRRAKNRLKYKKSTRHAETFTRKVIQALKISGEAKIILMKEIDDALVRSGKEFEENSDLYKTLLYEVADNDDVYLFSVYGSGWASILSPQIVFELAGTLNDYARGIRLYRAALKTKVGGEGSGRGAKATSWWRSHVYGTGLYDRTIRERIALSGRAAPFWSLIAHGSVGLPSDRPDGSYNPYPSRGVNFILNAEQAIKARYKAMVEEEKSAWERETRAFEAELEKAERLLGTLSNDVENLSTDYKRGKQALKKMGQDAQYASEAKLAEAARKFRVGEEFETERIELTGSGLSRTRRVRYSVSKVRGLLGYD